MGIERYIDAVKTSSPYGKGRERREIEVHEDCDQEVVLKWFGNERLPFCPECDRMVEGQTKYKTVED